MPEQNYSQLSYGLPFSEQAENAVLGSVLIDGDRMAEIADRLRPEHFYLPQNKEIYSCLLSMFTNGRPIDIVTAIEEVGLRGVFDSREQISGYLMNMAENVPRIGNLSSYIQILEDKYTQRSLIDTAQTIIDKSRDENEKPGVVLDLASQQLLDIQSSRDNSGPVKISKILVDNISAMQERAGQGNNSITGISTGFSALDRVIYGLNPSDLILLAARPAMGKTSFALNLAVNAARNTDKNIVIISLEMSREQIVNRMLSSEAGVDSSLFRSGDLSTEQWQQLISAAEYLSTKNIYVDDSPVITVPEMKSRLRQLGNMGLVVVDHLQLMTTGRRNENRVAEVTELSRSLKVLAKELQVPVICLAQLNRDLEKRDDKRPKLSDLRESGSIEQDADVVLMLYREAYHNKESENTNTAECIVTKNRHGELSTVMLGWDGAHTRFTSLEVYRNE